MDDAAVFIDGYNLYHGMCDAGLKPWLWVDLWKLSRMLVPKAANLAAVYYYTAPAKGGNGRRDRQGDFLAANQELNPDLAVRKGFMMEEDCCTCERCNRRMRKWREKRTDVNLAIEMVRGAMAHPRARFDLILLVTGDADQVTAVEVAQEHGVKVLVRFPPARHSAHLEQAVLPGNAYPISEKQLRRAQMEDEVTLLRTTGYTVRRPPEWGERWSSNA